jgi:hypothetical protein
MAWSSPMGAQVIELGVINETIHVRVRAGDDIDRLHRIYFRTSTAVGAC